MCLQELINKRYDIHLQLIEQMKLDTTMLAVKAENMAECATNIKGQGYSSFMAARDDFMKYLEEFRKNYTMICSPFENPFLNTSTRQ